MSSEAFRQQVLTNIEEHGRSVIGVFNAKPPFSYTIGNCLKDLPELLCIGPFDPNIVRVVLNSLSQKMIDNGRAFEDREIIDIGAPQPTMALEASDIVKIEYTLAIGNILRRPYEVMQIVSPDINGLFPWDVGCDTLYSDIPIFRKHALN